MLCPFCAQSIQELWQPFMVKTDRQGNELQTYERSAKTVTRPEKRVSAHIEVYLFWAVCPKCSELIVQLRRSTTLANRSTATAEHLAKLPTQESDWYALPQRKAYPLISNLIPDGMARDYREAHCILEDSPRMSSVLSRRILGDLLEQYVQIEAYTLAQQIDKFLEDRNHPARHRENLHYLRELGDFSAHTKKGSDGMIIDVTAEEAEWTLRVVSGLFDYFIVDPETDSLIRSRIDDKLKQAGRKAIKQLPEVKPGAPS